MVKKKSIIFVIIVLLILVILFIIYQIYFVKLINISYERTSEDLYNPMMGLAPNADYVELVGENTLVFLEITFRELEPEEGVYAFEEIREKYFLDRWKAEGKQVVFRFICDNPEEEAHMDIPDWLYEKTKDGDFYDSAYGKGYSPNYENQTFIDYHAKAIKALGKEFGQDLFFCYIQLGSLGHWGEWHVRYTEGIRRLPGEEVCEAYVTPYIEAFPNAILLMRRPFQMVKTYHMGVYNDMTGEPEDTKEWLGWIENGGMYDGPKTPHVLVPFQRIWEKRPIGGEFTSALTMRDMLETERDQTIALLESSHMTFIGSMMPTMEDDLDTYEEDRSMILKNVGYRYGIDHLKIRLDTLLKQASITITIGNHGVAPMYVNWPMYLYILDEQNEVIDKKQLPVDLTTIAGKETKEVTVKLQMEALKEGMVPLAIGIEHPNTKEAAVFLDMACKSTDKRYILFE